MGNRRWVILCIAVVSQVASVGALFGVPFVLPELREAYGLSTAQAGTLAGLPALGLLMTLFGWGVVIDRYGERFTMASSLALTAACLCLLGTADGVIGAGAVLVCVGASGGPVNAAGGRLVMTWFHERQRGLAMGIRQMAQPMGIGGAAAVMPLVAERWGFVAAMTLPATLAVVMVPLVLVFARPPRGAAGAGGAADDRREAPRSQADSAAAPAAHSPYRHAAIWRVHGVSMLLGVPQASLMTYSLVYLVDQHGWSAPAAGAAIAAVQVPGALNRMFLGVLSDRLGSRLRPVRVIAVLAATTLVLLTLSAAVAPAASVPLLLICLLLAMSHNGLTFTAAAETAGMAWAGRAMAAQNSLQAVSNTLTPVLMGLVITWFGIDAVYAAAAAFSTAAAAVVSADIRRRRGTKPTARV
ncbi:MFS transporter [Streptomonospora alba]|uniref:MFS transporter n=1 Tax=Streptomonospora alba TaxID=183763 RepID=UPI00187DD980|nr:MFS transporter [Streptomonospora alba]